MSITGQSESTSRRSGYAMRTVAREFKSETGVPKLELSCGHVKTDPALWYGDETAYAIRLTAHAITGLPRRVRCYECGGAKCTVQSDSARHAPGAFADDRTLCGAAHEGSPTDGEPAPIIAIRGETVTCKDCQHVIAHVRATFNLDGSVRR